MNIQPNRTTSMILALGLCASLTAGCATAGENTKKGAGFGALFGAAAGALTGYLKDPSGGALRGALIGAAAGGAIGAGTGAYMDKQQAEFEQQLARERAANDIEIQRMENEVLKLTMNSEVSFDVNSSSVKPSFKGALNKVSNILDQYNETEIVVVGHTDSSGSEEYNQTLSENRARSVAEYLQQRGVDGSRIATEGKGERFPRADNTTASGRAENRRVEIYVIPNAQTGAAVG